jgi:hypothetical protein
MLMWGLVLAISAPKDMVLDRSPQLLSSWIMLLARIVAALWWVWVMWETLEASAESRRVDYRLAITLWLTALCWGAATWQGEHAWAVAGMSVVSALSFAVMGWIVKRSFVVAVGAWIVAGIGVFFIQWPNSQRLSLVLLVGGSGVALQGTFELIRRARANPSEIEA